MKFSRCPSGKLCEYGQNTQALYWKVAGSMKVRAVHCMKCLAIYVKGPEDWTVYRISDVKGIPFRRSPVSPQGPR